MRFDAIGIRVRPGKGGAMLSFIDELEKMLAANPSSKKLSFSEIAEGTKTSVPVVLDYLAGAITDSLDIHDPVAKKEIEHALSSLKQRMHHKLESERRRLLILRERSVRALDRTMDKVRIFQLQKNWHSAYRTLSYYAGNHKAHLSNETFVTVCGDCLRLGIKADTNLQELSQWLQLGVRACLASESRSSLEDALDFIDAYKEYFDRSSGEKLVNKLLNEIMAPSPDLPAETEFIAWYPGINRGPMDRGV